MNKREAVDEWAIYVGRDRVQRPKGTVCTKEEDRTRQSDAVAADVNVIMRQFEKHGIVPPFRVPQGFADVTQAVTYHEMANQVREVNEYFEMLDPVTRLKFENDPEKMVAAFHSGQQVEVFQQLGLLEKPAEPALETVTTKPSPAGEAPRA